MEILGHLQKLREALSIKLPHILVEVVITCQISFMELKYNGFLLSKVVFLLSKIAAQLQVKGPLLGFC